jgi:hypothetical protein
MKRYLLKGLLSLAAVALAVVFSLTGAEAKETAKDPGRAKDAAKATAAGAKVDINSASQAELEKLPGIGAATAKKIIAGRPYATAADLSRAGVPAKTIEKITPLVTTGAAPAPLPAALPKASVPKAPTPAAPATARDAKPVPPPPAASGMVWVNPDSKIYHKSNSRWYGKTKQGSYMTESEAVKAGFRESKQGAQ